MKETDMIAIRNSILLVCMLLPFLVAGQQHAIKRDTSFNIPATLIKEQKKRPYITVAAIDVARSVKVKKDLVYRKLGNRELLLDIFYPKQSGQPKPAVLLIFGGGWRSGDKTHNHAMAAALAKEGFVAVSAEYRLSPEAIYPAAVLDLKAAVRWMRAHAKTYGIDKEKITVLGCSAGGQLAALLGTNSNNPHFEEPAGKDKPAATVQAVVDIDGTLAFHHPESEEGTVAAEWLGGTYAQKPEIWQEAAPLEHVGPATAPILFINSSIPRFHAGRDDMIRKLDALHIYSEVHTLEDTPHPFWFFNPWFRPMMQHIVGFLNKRFR